MTYLCLLLLFPKVMALFWKKIEKSWILLIFMVFIGFYWFLLISLNFKTINTAKSVVSCFRSAHDETHATNWQWSFHFAVFKRFIFTTTSKHGSVMLIYLVLWWHVKRFWYLKWLHSPFLNLLKPFPSKQMKQFLCFLIIRLCENKKINKINKKQ